MCVWYNFDIKTFQQLKIGCLQDWKRIDGFHLFAFNGHTNLNINH